MSQTRNTAITFLAIMLLALAARGQEAGVQAPPQTEEQQQPQAPELVVQSGTVIPIVLTAYMNTRSTQVGDRLYAEVTYPVWVQQRLVIPRGSLIRGTVTEVVRPGRIKGRGRMSVRFDDLLLPNGVLRPLVAGFRGIHGPGEEKLDRSRESVEMGPSTGADVGQVIGTTSSGAVIGAIAGGGSGAAIGAGAGAGVGIITALFTRGRELVLEPGTQFDLELKQPLRFVYGEVNFSSADGGRNWAAPARAPRNRSRRSGPLFSPFPVRRGFPFPFIWD